MFIRMVDEGLERLLRTELPMPAIAGDVSFAVPSRDWSESLVKPTVNFYLFDVSRSAMPSRSSTRRVNASGKGERRGPPPMIELNYMVSAWDDEVLRAHELLGGVISLIARLDMVPETYLDDSLESSVQLSFVEDDRHRARDIWNGAGNALRAGFSMHATVAADAGGWSPEAAPITGIKGVTKRGTDRANANANANANGARADDPTPPVGG
jgi:uncharacterized protein DUF4255